MKDCLKNLPKEDRDNKLPGKKELKGCPFWIRLILEPFYLCINAFFIVQWIRSFSVKDQEALKIFCFPHSREGLLDTLMFGLSGISAIFGFIVSGGHFVILLGETCIGDCCQCRAQRIKDFCFLKLSVRAYNAIALFNVTWIEQVSMTCAKPDSGAYILDFENAPLLSGTTLLSLIVTLLNFVINAVPKSFPCRKSLKIGMKIADCVVQPFNYGVSLYFWFRKFESDSFMFWVLFAWWAIRIAHSVWIELRKCGKSPEEAQEAGYTSVEMTFADSPMGR